MKIKFHGGIEVFRTVVTRAVFAIKIICDYLS